MRPSIPRQLAATCVVAAPLPLRPCHRRSSARRREELFDRLAAFVEPARLRPTRSVRRAGSYHANSTFLRASLRYSHNNKKFRERIMANDSIAAALLLMTVVMNGAKAQDYPSRTVTVIVPFAAGGPADITGRI